MKMAKASEADMGMALKLCSALEAMDRRSLPAGIDGENGAEDFDWNDDAQCGQALRHILSLLQDGSIGRVIWGMYVMLDPANKVVDPDADTLEDHPETVAAMADAERYRWLQKRLMGADFDWNESGAEVLVFEMPKGVAVSPCCDATIDRAMAADVPAND